jgi:hypothetical protein
MDELGGQPRIRISGPSGLLAAVPNSLGFHPTDSLVLMCFAGDRPALGPVARVDLPRGRDHDLVRYLTGTALTHADCVVVVCYPRRRRRPAILDDLLTELRSGGVGVMNALIVHAGRVWEAPEARPLRLADSTAVPGHNDPTVRALAAENALSGRVVLASREQLRASIAGPRGGRRQAAEQAISAVAEGRCADLPDRDDVAAADRLDPSTDALDPPGYLVPLPDRIHRVIDCALAEATGRGAVDVRLAAELAVACLDRPVRDGVLMRGVFELDRSWLSMLISCATWTPDPYAAGICAVLATIAYRHGEGALAQVSADRCLRAEPGNELIHLLLGTMSAGAPPDVLDGMLLPPEEFAAELAAEFAALQHLEDDLEFADFECRDELDGEDGSAVA